MNNYYYWCKNKSRLVHSITSVCGVDSVQPDVLISAIMSSVVSLILCLICAAACVELARCQTKNLYFSFTTAHSPGRYSALGAVPAVDLALQRINDDPDILPGYNLSYAMDVGNSLVNKHWCISIVVCST